MVVACQFQCICVWDEEVTGTRFGGIKEDMILQENSNLIFLFIWFSIQRSTLLFALLLVLDAHGRERIPRRFVLL